MAGDRGLASSAESLRQSTYIRASCARIERVRPCIVCCRARRGLLFPRNALPGLLRGGKRTVSHRSSTKKKEDVATYLLIRHGRFLFCSRRDRMFPTRCCIAFLTPGYLQRCISEQLPLRCEIIFCNGVAFESNVLRGALQGVGIPCQHSHVFKRNRRFDASYGVCLAPLNTCLHVVG